RRGCLIEEARLPVLNPVNDSSRLTVFGYIDFYTHRISLQDQQLTPTVNTAYLSLLRDTALRQKIAAHPFLFTSALAPLVITHFSAHQFTADIHGTTTDTLHLLQQYHPDWSA